MIIKILIIVCFVSLSVGVNYSVIEDSNLNFTGFGFKYGHKVDEHNVVTDDGYVLKLFHIPGDSRRPVLLVHGIIDSSDTFIIRGNTSLAVTLANNGYDVWALNTRGNRYSRAHVNLNPDGVKFWDYSFHEMGYYDLPAAIDFILERTAQQQLSAIAHSQGNTLFYVLGSTRTEYNEKIKIMIALAPICFLHHVKPPVSTLLSSLPTIASILGSVGAEEVFSDNSDFSRLYRIVCSQKDISYKLCGRGFFFAIAGSDPNEIEPDFLPVAVAHYPTATSRKNGIHVAQVALSRNFSQFDYGPRENQAVYNSIFPPPYDLSEVKMNVALFVARNDLISSVRDTEVLRDKLPNVVKYLLLEHKSFNHIDHVWGRNMAKYLYPHLFSILDSYN